MIMNLPSQEQVDKNTNDISCLNDTITTKADSSTVSSLSTQVNNLSNNKQNKLTTVSITRFVTYQNGYNTYIGFGVNFSTIVSISYFVTGGNGGSSGTGFPGCACIDALNITELSGSGCRVWHERADGGSNTAYLNVIVTGY